MKLSQMKSQCVGIGTFNLESWLSIDFLNETLEFCTIIEMISLSILSIKIYYNLTLNNEDAPY